MPGPLPATTVTRRQRTTESPARPPWRVALVTALWCIAVAGGPAWPQGAYPAAFLERAIAHTGATVTGYRISGIHRSLAADLANGLALQGRRRFLRRERIALSVTTLGDDLRRVALFLARHGYPRPQLNPRIEPSGDGKKVTIVLDIDPGHAVRVADVVLVGFPPIDLPSPGIETGTRVVDARIDTAAVILRDALRRQGYAFAEVLSILEPLDSMSVQARFTADPGPLYRWGGISVDGTSNDVLCLVRKVAVVPVGEPFSPRIVRRIEERLRMLDLFRRVHVTPAARSDTAGVVDLVVRLAGLDPRRIEAGLGVRTDEGILVRAGWMHRNLLGGGRGLLARAQYGSHLRSVTAMLWFPGLLRADLRQDVTVDAEWQREENYRLDKFELELGTRYHHSLRLTAQAGIRESVASYRQSALDGTGGTVDDEITSLLFAGLRFDGTDNRLDPRHGWVASIDGTATVPGVRSDVRYAVAQGSVSLYRPLWGAVVATRLSVGLAWAFEGTVDLPPDVRFYSGGSTTMRGFARRKLGPVDSEGNPLGGSALVETGIELRVPAVRPFVLAFFVDGGQVWNDPITSRLDEMEAALGTGVRVATPVGHIRLDFARRITNVVPDQPKGAYHLALGQAF